MGASGSLTAKANIHPLLFPFTKWEKPEMRQFLLRGQRDFPETFALRKHEFDYLLGLDYASVHSNQSKMLFEGIFDTDKNGLVDKFEVMCIMCLVSKISSEHKVEFFFDLFNFNNKGYLNPSEFLLLLMTITKGAQKIDAKFGTPTLSTLQRLVEDAFVFAQKQPQQLRKPELVDFMHQSIDALTFLECWRGHAAQVMLRHGMKWRDLSFPCNQLSVTPTTDMAWLGLPPDDFIVWRRFMDKHGQGAYLFTHTTSFMKTVDRRKLYKGDGVIGDGHLMQCYLADSWFLNALACMTARPLTIERCFASTGQESHGRFCTRFYEGLGWRSVYVDDRLPCSLSHAPLFASSSSALELWPMILEKGLAKYMGSYAHIGAAASRSDSTLMALRLLTGGHVWSVAVRSLRWRSFHTTGILTTETVSSSQPQDGLQLVRTYWRAGALLAFGRSMASSLVSPPPLDADRNALPPAGRLFPVVGEKTVQGYVYLVLRDAWDLFSTANKAVDSSTGHCNTFAVRVDDVVQLYDTLVICACPDSLRLESRQLRLKPWTTDIKPCVTQGRDRPASFLISIPPPSQANASGEEKNGEKQEESIDDKVNQLRLKEPLDLSALVRKGAKGPGGASDQRGDGEEEDVVEMFLTVSSACEWTFGGSAAASAQLRMRVVAADEETRRRLRVRERTRLQRQRDEISALRRQKQTEAELLVLQSRAPEHPGGDDHASEEISLGPGDAPPGEGAANPLDIFLAVEQELERKVAELDEQQDGDKGFDVNFSAQRCWMSQALKLVPGNYLVVADVGFRMPYEEARIRALPRDLSEASWLDNDFRLKLMHKIIGYEGLRFQTDAEPDADGADERSHGAASASSGLTPSQSLDNASLEKLEELAKRIFPSDVKDLQAEREALQLQQRILAQPLPHEIFLQLSCHHPATLTIVSPELLPHFLLQEQQQSQRAAWLPEEVEVDTWPFLVEDQREVSARELSNALTALTQESRSLGQRLVQLADHYRSQRTVAIRREAVLSLRRNQAEQQPQEETGEA